MEFKVVPGRLERRTGQRSGHRGTGQRQAAFAHRQGRPRRRSRRRHHRPRGTARLGGTPRRGTRQGSAQGGGAPGPACAGVHPLDHARDRRHRAQGRGRGRALPRLRPARREYVHRAHRPRAAFGWHAFQHGAARAPWRGGRDLALQLPAYSVDPGRGAGTCRGQRRHPQARSAHAHFGRRHHRPRFRGGRPAEGPPACAAGRRRRGRRHVLRSEHRHDLVHGRRRGGPQGWRDCRPAPKEGAA